MHETASGLDGQSAISNVQQTTFHGEQATSKHPPRRHQFLGAEICRCSHGMYLNAPVISSPLLIIFWRSFLLLDSSPTLSTGVDS